MSTFAVFLRDAGVRSFRITPTVDRESTKRARRNRLEDELWKAAEQGRLPVDKLPNHARKLTAILGNRPIFENFLAVANGSPPTF